MDMIWEQRWHPLREEWVILASHRQDRPWLGERAGGHGRRVPSHDPRCTFCPGNRRVSGKANPDYDRVFVFDNDLPCVSPMSPGAPPAPQGIYRNRPARGVARVICYSPRHDLTLARMDGADVLHLLGVWQEQHRELAAMPDVNHVLIFENKGEAVGVSNPHPHGQIYATNFVFKTIETEATAARHHWRRSGRVLFQEILAAERDDGRRILCERDSAVAFIPYFARYPYETYVAPRQTHASIADLADAERADLAAVLHETLVRFDNLWRMPFPYVLALHQAPTDGGTYEGFHFHIEIHPPLRKPNLLKFTAGPEVGGGCFLNDTSPEAKAAELQGVPDVHYGGSASA